MTIVLSFLDSLWDNIRRYFDDVVIYFFNSDFKIFLWRVGIFSLFFLFCFYFLLKVHINFYISTFVLSTCYSSFVHATCRPFRNIQRATRISVCVAAISQSHEFLLKVHWLSYFFCSSTTPRPSHQRVIILFHDDARDSTSTTSRCFLNDVGHYGVPICGGDVI